MQKPKILIVDDDPISQATLSAYLSQIAVIMTADDGTSAIIMIKDESPDLIILDNVMPGLSGLDVCRHLKGSQAYASIPVIFISSIDDINGKVAAFSAGAIDYITKPFLCDEVKSRVASHLDLYFLRKDLENRVAERTNELKLSQARLFEAQVRMHRAEKLASLGTLASGIAHEINTPVQFIGNNLEFMQMAIARFDPIVDKMDTEYKQSSRDLGIHDIKLLMPEIIRAIDESIDGVSRITNIVHAIKMFSHPGTIILTQQSPTRLIETAVLVSRNSWKNAAELSIDIDPDLPTVPCNGSDIDQVLLALILNAVDAIEARHQSCRGQICVSARQVGENIEFSVTDNGCGISKDVRPYVWDLFFTTKEPGKGTGQGLAICHNIIVTKHGGIIDYDCNTENLTRFYFRIPISGKPTNLRS